jgi:hypothetical protein
VGRNGDVMKTRELLRLVLLPGHFIGDWEEMVGDIAQKAAADERTVRFTMDFDRDANGEAASVTVVWTIEDEAIEDEDQELRVVS